MPSNKVRAAVVGCGRIASLFSKDLKRQGVVTHAHAYQVHKNYELVSAADLNQKRLKDFGKKWQLKSLYSSYQDMFCDEDLDMVSICTPTETHFEIAKAAMEAGIRLIFCEKPLVASLREAEALEKLAEKYNAIVAVNHSRRWDAFEQKISRFIASGKLGAIQSIDAYYTAGIANTGSHLIDLLRMLANDEVSAVQALPKKGQKIEQDPTCDIQLTFKNGFHAFLHGLERKHYLMFEIDLYGTKGRIRVQDSGFAAKYWKVKANQQFSGLLALMEQKHSFGKGYQRIFMNALDNFLKARNKKQTIQSSLSDGKAALEVILAVHESLEKGGKEVLLPLRNRKLILSR